MVDCKTGDTISIDELGTVKKVMYSEREFRKIYYENPKNKSNYKTIIKEILVDGIYVPNSRLDVGEKYTTYYRYDSVGKIDLERRYNRKTKSLNTREVISKSKDGSVILNTYNKEKTITFNINSQKFDDERGKHNKA